MRTCVCYLKIQQSHGKQSNARFANEGHLRFVSVAFCSIKAPQQIFHEILYMICYILTVCNSLYKQCITPCTLH